MNHLPPSLFPAPAICALLTQLGLTPNYIGFFHTAFALELALRDPQDLCLVTKRIYPAVARQYHTSASAVERNIRLSAARVWNCAPDKLSSLSAIPLTQKPSNAPFLALLCAHLAGSAAPPL